MISNHALPPENVFVGAHGLDSNLVKCVGRPSIVPTHGVFYNQRRAHRRCQRNPGTPGPFIKGPTYQIKTLMD